MLVDGEREKISAGISAAADVAEVDRMLKLAAAEFGDEPELRLSVVDELLDRRRVLQAEAILFEDLGLPRAA